ncbi:MAG TPA: ROK family protein [Symbiobacteriaceae bacterium]
MERFAIGIDLGGTNIVGGLVDQDGNPHATIHRPTPASLTPPDVLGAIKEIIAHLLREAGSTPVVGIGLGIPGLLDRQAGKVIFSPNIPWRDVPVLREFEEFGLPLDMDNDVRCHALGELHFGAGKGLQHFILLTLGTGIGSGIVINGELYRGSSNMAGEIGHIPLRPDDGPLCGCGKRGCFEAIASGKNIGRRAREAQIANTSRELFEKAAAGDRAAAELVDRVIRDLAVGIATYVNLMNPQRVIIGGGVAQAGDQLFQPLRRYVDELTMPGIRGTFDIVPARFGREAGVVGAASLIPALTR